MQTTTTTDFPKRWYSVEEVAEITGQSVRLVRDACLFKEIPGAYRKSVRGSSPWKIPGPGAQIWFERIQGLRRDDMGRGA